MNSINSISNNDDIVLDMVTRVTDLAQKNAENYTRLQMAREYVSAQISGSKSTYIDAKPLLSILDMKWYKDALEEAAETEADE